MDSEEFDFTITLFCLVKNFVTLVNKNLFRLLNELNLTFPSLTKLRRKLCFAKNFTLIMIMMK